MTILDRIVRDKREELETRRRAISLSDLAARCRALEPARDFESALTAAGGADVGPGARPRPGSASPDGGRNVAAAAPGRPSAGSGGPVRVIAELKKASPSRGVLAPALEPVALARVYSEHGAAAISVLTDEKYFQGRLELLGEVRRAVPIPLLRKDFVLDEYQLWEACAAGADAALLIASILDEPALADLIAAAKGIGLAALVEVHTRPELETALRVGARIIGINNRDLRTFETRIETTLELVPAIPPGPLVVSESGFFTAADVRRVADAGVRAILVGEALVRASDPGATLRELQLRP